VFLSHFRVLVLFFCTFPAAATLRSGGERNEWGTDDNVVGGKVGPLSRSEFGIPKEGSDGTEVVLRGWLAMVTMVEVLLWLLGVIRVSLRVLQVGM
jgi:hypothetical protein